MGEINGYWYDVMFIVVIGQTIRVGYTNSHPKTRVGCNLIPKK